jgi:hypothetical protein
MGGQPLISIVNPFSLADGPGVGSEGREVLSRADRRSVKRRPERALSDD